MKKTRPWPAYLWGFFILAAGIMLFIIFQVSEDTAENILPDIFFAIYRLLGKWGLLASFALLSSVFFIMEIRSRRRRRPDP